MQLRFSFVRCLRCHKKVNIIIETYIISTVFVVSQSRVQAQTKIDYLNIYFTLTISHTTL